MGAPELPSTEPNTFVSLQNTANASCKHGHFYIKIELLNDTVFQTLLIFWGLKRLLSSEQIIVSRNQPALPLNKNRLELLRADALAFGY